MGIVTKQLRFPLMALSVRIKDDFGSGKFGASRGPNRTHKGVDYLADKGEVVKSAISGTFTKYGYAYQNDLTQRYIEVTNNDLRVRIFYVNKLDSLTLNQKVKAGDIIAKVGNISERYNDGTRTMQNHIHVEVFKDGTRVNPDLFFNENSVKINWLDKLKDVPLLLKLLVPSFIILMWVLIAKK